MGQQQTKSLSYNLPTKKNFKLSYCVQENIKETCDDCSYINLSKSIEEFKVSNLILKFIYSKCKNQGYSFQEREFNPISMRIDHILEYFEDKGIVLSNKVIIDDIKFVRTCYEPKLNNIYYFLSKGKILIGGIILTDDFIKSVLNIEPQQHYDVISDIVLIVGYDTEYILLKTNWCEDLVKVENKYIKNIRELWDVEIKTFY